MRLWADFNEYRNATGLIYTSLRGFIPEGEPYIGQAVELWDHEGNTCWGVVEEVRGPIVWLRLNLSTWCDSTYAEMKIVGKSPNASLGSSTRGAA